LRSRITEALRTLITLKGLQRPQTFSGISGSADAQIGALVYELHRLTKEEIGVVKSELEAARR